VGSRGKVPGHGVREAKPPGANDILAYEINIYDIFCFECAEVD